MAEKHVATYLNDHLAGATMILELLSRLEEVYKGTDKESFFADLNIAIQADSVELEKIIERLKVAQSAPRKAAAWLSEKVSQVKLRLDDRAGGTLYLLESLELIAVGIEGKLALWRSLDAASDFVPELQDLDFARLQERAEDQRSRVESMRLETSNTLFQQRENE